MPERFISEPIRPAGPVSAGPMAAGEPGLPSAFRWRRRTLRVAELLERWKEAGACSHGSGERYVKRHRYRVRTDRGELAELYFERQPRKGAKASWVLYTLKEAEPGNPAPREES